MATRRELQLLAALASILECGLLGHNGELKAGLRQPRADLEDTAQGPPGPAVRPMRLAAQAYYGPTTTTAEPWCVARLGCSTQIRERIGFRA